MNSHTIEFLCSIMSGGKLLDSFASGIAYICLLIHPSSYARLYQTNHSLNSSWYVDRRNTEIDSTYNKIKDTGEPLELHGPGTWWKQVMYSLGGYEIPTEKTHQNFFLAQQHHRML